jgi:hypothetical protein
MQRRRFRVMYCSVWMCRRPWSAVPSVQWSFPSFRRRIWSMREKNLTLTEFLQTLSLTTCN